MKFKTVTINAKPRPGLNSKTFRFLWQAGSKSVILTIVGSLSIEHYEREDAQKLYRELLANGGTIQPQGVELHDAEKMSYGTTICRSLEMLTKHG